MSMKEANGKDEGVFDLSYVGSKTGAFKPGQTARPAAVQILGGDPPTVAAAEVAIDSTTRLTLENVRAMIVAECDALKALLLEKNAGYGNSALDPVRLFSRASPIEQLKVRIDDKLSRISRGDFSKVKEEDLKVVTNDLLGYLILIRVGWKLGLE